MQQPSFTDQSNYSAISLGIDWAKLALPYNNNPYPVNSTEARLWYEGYEFGQSLRMTNIIEV